MNSYNVFPKDRPEWERSVNAVSAGKAKRQLLRSLHDAGWMYPYTDLRCRKVGGPITTDDFKRCAEYRGVPFARCGMKVIFSDRDEGIIQGHGSGANFNILFTTGKNKGLVLNCHPNWHITYLEDDGTVIRKFGP